MSFFVKIQEKIIFLKKLLKKNTTDFLGKEIIWQYLDQIDLSLEERNILKSSFRSRIKPSEDNYIFQFRISPKSLTEDQLYNIADISLSIKNKLEKIIPNISINVQLKISDCCNGDCYGCDTFGRN